MLLHLIRHADALPTDSNSNDKGRALSPFGRAQAKDLADYLGTRINDTEVWCSGAQRTKETMEILAERMTFTDVKIYERFYLCQFQTFLQRIYSSNSDADLIIVAHNFGISDLLMHFTDDMTELSTCEYVCINFEGFSRNELSKGTGIIVDRYRSSLNYF